MLIELCNTWKPVFFLRHIQLPRTINYARITLETPITFYLLLIEEEKVYPCTFPDISLKHGQQQKSISNNCFKVPLLDANLIEQYLRLGSLLFLFRELLLQFPINARLFFKHGTLHMLYTEQKSLLTYRFYLKLLLVLVITF